MGLKHLKLVFWGIGAIAAVSCLGASTDASTTGYPDPSAPTMARQDQPAEQADSSAQPQFDRPGVLLKVSLPVDSKSAAQVRQALKQIADQAPQFIRPEERQVVVLQFDTSAGKTGRGSELEACQSLARFLGSSELNKIETVAYIPADRQNENTPTPLMGHAVLIAIAANQIAMDQGTSIGNAGADEENIDGLVEAVYKGIASQRLTLPIPVVQAMLEKKEQLFRVRTDAGIVYVNSAKLKELESTGKAIETNTISQPGRPAELTSEQLTDFRLLRLQVESKTDLARQLDLVPGSLDRSPSLQGAWKAIAVSLPPYIDNRTVQWISRSVNYELSRNPPPNLIIFDITNNDGDIDACLELSRLIVELDADIVQTVAFVQDRARGPVGIVALACDQLVMAARARLGGHGDEFAGIPFEPDELTNLKPMVKAFAEEKQQDWSLMLSMIDPDLTVSRYRNKKTGQIRLLSDEELRSIDAAEDWGILGPLDTEQGLTGTKAEQLFIAKTIAEDMAQIKSYYQLEDMPRALQPSATDRWVERAAGFLASPFIAPWLLFAGMFLFSSEMSAPGLGVPGFLAACCFMLFFWSQYLGGNAHWLEIMMFLAGIVFLGMEIFVIPGFGIFGVGGMLMIVVSLILASQNFIIPNTTEELARLPQSLLPVVGAGMGFFAAVIALRKVLPNSPYFNRMMLKPRERRKEAGFETQQDPEAIVDWSYLQGETGETITRLFPAGKARINGKVYDVITDGKMVDKGEKISVIQAIGNRVVVSPLEND
jgi:membrane-bound serine protease (ClpP class)